MRKPFLGKVCTILREVAAGRTYTGEAQGAVAQATAAPIGETASAATMDMHQGEPMEVGNEQLQVSAAQLEELY